MTYNEIKKHKWKRNDITDDICREVIFLKPIGEVTVVGIISNTWVAIQYALEKPTLENIKNFGKGQKYEAV